MPTKEIAVKAVAVPTTITKQVSVSVQKATELTIKDAESMKEATTLLSSANKVLDSVTKEKEKVTKPLNEALKAERGRWKPIEVQLEEAVSIIRKKMTAYQTVALQQQAQKQENIANRVGEGRGKLTAETAVRQMEAVVSPEETVSTEQGSVQFRTVQKFELEDISKVPLECLILNETMVRDNMRKNIQHAGIRYYEEQVPYNTR